MYKVTNSNKLQIHTSVFINLNTGYVMIDHQISLCLISQTSCRQINITCSGGSRIFPRGGCEPSRGGVNTPNFPENCMKSKEFGRPGGRASLTPPLDPPMTWWHKVNTAHNIHNGNNSSNYSSDHTNKYNLVV